jgi:hypothetical protein
VTGWFVCDVSTDRGAGPFDPEQTATVMLQALTTREVEAIPHTASGIAVRCTCRSDSCTVLTHCRKSQHLDTFSPLLSSQSYHGSGGQCPASNHGDPAGYNGPCRVYGRQSGTGTGLSPISPLYPCQSIPQFLCISPLYDRQQVSSTNDQPSAV